MLRRYPRKCNQQSGGAYHFKKGGIWIFMRILDVNGQTSFFTNLRWMEKGIWQQWRSDLSDRIYEIFIRTAAVCQYMAILSTKSECWKKRQKANASSISHSIISIWSITIIDFEVYGETRTVTSHVNITHS